MDAPFRSLAKTSPTSWTRCGWYIGRKAPKFMHDRADTCQYHASPPTSGRHRKWTIRILLRGVGRVLASIRRWIVGSRSHTPDGRQDAKPPVFYGSFHACPAIQASSYIIDGQLRSMAKDKKKDDGALTLFGDDEVWRSDAWTASDDRVRGGKSQSYLDTSNDKIGRFHGTLDIKTLGGAGFASQRTTGDDRKWDLSDYAGIQINVAKGDKKRYTFILKDKLLPPSDNGREQAVIAWEIDFELPPQAKPGDTKDKSVFVPWKAFNPTYRGKPKKDAQPLDLKSIKRMSIMMRSFFGSQDGDFSLSITSIKALKKAPKTTSDSFLNVSADDRKLEDGLSGTPDNKQPAPQPALITKCLVASVLSFMICYKLARWSIEICPSYTIPIPEVECTIAQKAEGSNRGHFIYAGINGRSLLRSSERPYCMPRERSQGYAVSLHSGPATRTGLNILATYTRQRVGVHCSAAQRFLLYMSKDLVTQTRHDRNIDR
nr:uncharacterized protein c9e9.15 [Quercus suber]